MHIPWVELHGAITHFPIALLLTGFAFEIGGLLFRKAEWQTVSFWMITAAVLMALPSALSGLLAGNQLYTRSAPAIFYQHRLAAITTVVIGLILLAWLWKNSAARTARGVMIPTLVLMTLASAAVGYTGYLGGQMVFGQSTNSEAVPTPASSSASVKVPSVPDNVITAGIAAYKANQCVSCHTMNGVGAKSGPDLTHEAQRHADIAWQEAHLKNPSKVHPGSGMPPYDYLPPDQLTALASYMATRK